MGTEARRGALAGVAAVCATYVAFLLHAQFALLALLARSSAGAGSTRAVMASMGLAGLAASLGTGALLRRIPPRRLVLAGLLGCAGVELLSLLARTTPAFVVVAALVGAFTGVLTVAIAADLPALIPGPNLGLRAGLGTGFAYLVANLPPVFHGGPAVQTLVSAGACVAATVLLAARGPRASAPAEPSREAGDRATAAFALATLVLGFLALVWLDSAVFRIVQETAALRGTSWGPGSRTLVQGATHLLGGLIAGALLDRGRLRAILLGTFLLFVVAFPLMTHGVAAGGPLYALGIAAYSTALVVAPTQSRSSAAFAPRWRAAILYAVAGWLGSALGIGMVQDLHRIPVAFTVAAGAVLLLGMLRSSGSLRVLRHAAAPALVLATAGVLLARPAPSPAGETAVERGRRTYLAEGCVQCHSQYVRPRSESDVAAWGPARTDQLLEHPPLIGTRRLGPDLLDVGTRRDATWNRLHLIDPRALTPASRMPSYAHLFANGDTRGDDLVAYLTSLGASTLDARLAATRAAPMPRIAHPDLALGRRLFAESCAPCHGAKGRGDGPLAPAVAGPFLDLAMTGLPRCERCTGDETLDLERLVRFGNYGTPMAGHELFTDEQVAAVVARVQEIRAGAAP